MLRSLIAAFMIIGVWSSRKAWLSSERLFPLIPAFAGLPSLPAPLDQLIPVALTVTLLLTVFGRRTRLFVALFLVVFSLAVLLDVTRLQPWCYQYAAMFVAICVADPESEESDGASIWACRLILSAIYFYSGLHKLNSMFASEILGWLASGLAGGKNEHFPVPEYVAYSCAILESLMGLGLLFPQTRLIAVIGISLMHVFLIGCLGPGGLNWNSVIWPWNFAMIFFLIILFVLVKDTPLKSLKANPILATCVVALFWVAPLFSFIGKWDYYPSFALYSGDSYNGDIGMSKEVYETLPKSIKADCIVEENRPVYLNIGTWATDDIGMPCYPQERSLISAARQFVHNFNAGQVTLRLRRGTYLWQQGKTDLSIPLE